MALTCEQVRDRLSAWLDGEAPAAEAAVLEAHLDGCAACRAELARLEALDEALGGLAVPVPPGLAERVLARLPKQERPRRRWGQSLALAACLVMGLLLGGSVARDLYLWTGANGGGDEVVALEDFHDFPQGSLGTVLASYQPDEGNGS